ncbi:MAG: hypothetical protein ACQXXH_04355 [Candidatus Bathyarchaeia archaeon]|nr:hypothetical protein [Candidatus Bathyarchaeota archaeon A05DMB-4]MDH7594971.1 hypothetical protein [Candidatus Bathyarchaeota archaeon]
MSEERVTKILTNPQLSPIKRMLEKDHAIDCLFLLYMGKGKWKDAKDYMRKHGLTLSDGTFRMRMMEIESLGMAKSTPIDPLKKFWTITRKGENITKLLLDMFEKL